MVKTVIKHYIIDYALKYLLDKYTEEFSTDTFIYLHGNEINRSHIGMRLYGVDFTNCYPIPISDIRKLIRIKCASEYVVTSIDDSCHFYSQNKQVYFLNKRLDNFNTLRQIKILHDVVYKLGK